MQRFDYQLLKLDQIGCIRIIPFTESAVVHLLTGSQNLVLSEFDKKVIRTGTMALSEAEILLESTFRQPFHILCHCLFDGSIFRREIHMNAWL